jgi:GH18 family chitinase
MHINALNTTVLLLSIATYATAQSGNNKTGVATSNVLTMKKYIGYFVEWGIYDRKFKPSDIPLDSLTHINYAFGKIANGELLQADEWADTQIAYPGDTESQPFKGNFWQLNVVAKAKKPSLKTLMSVGGWGDGSRPFAALAATDASRRHFAQSCKAFLEKYKFDGLDVDWEYPENAQEGANFVALMTTLREVLGADKVLSIACSANPSVLDRMDVVAMARVLDFINVMTYDYAGSWDTKTGLNAPLNPVAGGSGLAMEPTMKHLLAKGVPADKLVLGLPLYGRGFLGVSKVNNGLDQPFTGLPAGSWEKGVYDYKDIKKMLAQGTLTRHVDPVGRVPYAYSEQRGEFVSYDDAESIGNKCRWLMELGLGGAMTWELSGDDQGELSKVIASTLGVSNGVAASAPVSVAVNDLKLAVASVEDRKDTNAYVNSTTENVGSAKNETATQVVVPVSNTHVGSMTGGANVNNSNNNNVVAELSPSEVAAVPSTTAADHGQQDAPTEIAEPSQVDPNSSEPTEAQIQQAIKAAPLWQPFLSDQTKEKLGAFLDKINEKLDSTVE